MDTDFKEEFDLDDRYDDNFKIYMDEISQFPVLTKEEERELAIRIKEGDEEAKLKFYSCNLRLVVSVAKNYFDHGVDSLDLIQEGNLGLLRAVEKFDINLGFRFSTYATWWIRQAMPRTLARQGRGISLPFRMMEEQRAYYNAWQTLAQEEGTENISFSQIAEKLNWSLERVQTTYNSILNFTSLNTYVNEEDSAELEEFIPDDVVSIEEMIENKGLANMLKSIFEEAKLSPREKEVVLYRTGVLTGKQVTLTKLGEQYGVSRERIRQLEERALKKLNAANKRISSPNYVYIKRMEESKKSLSSHPTENLEEEKSLLDQRVDAIKEKTEKELLNVLPELDAKVVALKLGYLGEEVHTNQEIASLMQLDEDHVKEIINRAKLRWKNINSSIVTEKTREVMCGKGSSASPKIYQKKR